MAFGSKLAAGALVVLALLPACGRGGGGGQAAQAPAAVPAPVASPLVETVVNWNTYSGLFAASKLVDVRARVSGYLDAVHFEDGQIVQEGDLLFTIDPRPYEAAAQAAEGDVERTQAAADQAGRDMERARRLVTSNTVAEQAFETARAAHQEAEAALASAQAALRQAQLNLEFTRIVAPVTGRVSERKVDPGNLVNANSDSLTTIVATTPIYFNFDAPESALLAYQRDPHDLSGFAVQVRLQGETDYRWPGRLTFADNVVDPATGTISLRAEIDNPDGFLRPGLFGEARVRASAPYDAILVPQSAVLADATRRLVYVLGAGNVVEARAVELGPPSGDLQVIQSGLTKDDRIVVNGLQQLKPGAAVDPQPAQIERRVPAQSSGGQDAQAGQDQASQGGAAGARGTGAAAVPVQ